jgi:hypothetical protein
MGRSIAGKAPIGNRGRDSKGGYVPIVHQQKHKYKEDNQKWKSEKQKKEIHVVNK